MPYVNPITPVSGRNGAPMGRHTGPDYLDTSERLYLRRVPLNSGGYDAGGAYWGLGQPLYHVQDCDGNGRIFRATSREDAKALVREDWPDARFHGDKDTRESLVVVFRAERSGDHKGSVTAVFPSQAERGGLYTCYAHIGQHSSCSRDWYATTRPTTPEEYAGLLRELRGIYDDVRLVVRKRAKWA